MNLNGLKFKKYLQSDFVKNILILFSGSTISQLIPFLVLPLLSRLYTNAEFGEMFLYISIISVLTVISTLKYEIAIVLPRNENSAIHLLLFSFMIALILCLIFYMLIFIGKGYLIKYIDKDNVLGNWLYFIPVSVLFIGIVQASNFWLNRNTRFKLISSGKIIKSTSTVTCQAASGYSYKYFKPYGLVGGVIIGQIVHGIFLLIYLLKFNIFKHFNFSFRRMRKIAWYYRDIPMFNTTSGLVNMISNHLPIFLLSSYYSIESVGLYGMAMRLTATPLSMINSAIGEVFYSNASKLFNENRKEFIRFTLQTTKKLVKIAIIPFFVLFIFAPKIFLLLLGPDWEKAGIYAQIILPWLLVMFLNAHLTSLITIIRKQKEYLFYSITFLLFRFIALYIGYKCYNNIIYSLIFYSITGVIFNLFFLVYILRINKASLNF